MSINEKFESLYNDWLSEILFMSDPDDMFKHKSLQEIIRLAEKDQSEILQCIFDKMREQNTVWWFKALTVITGENPLVNIEPQNRGNIEMSTNLWLKWALDNGYEKSSNIKINLDHATELEWLKFFYFNADFGPSHGDVMNHIKNMFKSQTGKKMPKGYIEETDED